MEARDLEKYHHLHYKKADISAEDDDISLIYKLTATDGPSCDVDKAWDTFTAKLSTTKSTSEENTKVFSLWPVVRVAAIILITIGLGFSVWQFVESPKDPIAHIISVEAIDNTESITLPDGSRIWLSKGSKVSYDQNFENRSIDFLGEGYFDIVKSENQFLINTNSANVRVLGTAFNLKTSKTADVSVYVTRGLVALEMGNAKIKVSAGKEGLYQDHKKKLVLNHHPDVNDLSWKTGKFVFEGTALQDAVSYLSKYYDKDIKISSEVLSQCKVTGTFENQALGEILNNLSYVLDFSVTFSENNVLLEGKGC
ncbi:MAG: FecR domain-containing protein [Cyclobacteriaceae bacterium]|nr:FecR domain-containing protein [Cyclobacteriaceae bacterium HetDA_MAG_MS6]